MREEYDFSKGIKGKYAGRVDTTSIRKFAWEHPSVKLLALHGHDPIEVITEQARGIVLAALDAGAIMILVDSVRLAHFRKVHVLPTQEVQDARVIQSPQGEPVIEYN